MIDNNEVQEHAEELLDFGADLSDVAATAESLVHFAYYESSMNYIYQAFRVDYSDEVSHSEYDHNDWEDVDPSYNIGAGGPKFAK